jgi:GNAT superfamily N-acetyltransferase
MRIAVRARCQRQGIGRKLIEYLTTNYPAHLYLDVSTNNVSGCTFYKRIGLTIEKLYLCGKDQVEFATFITPEGFKLQPRQFLE